jgi:hypothetical protein
MHYEQIIRGQIAVERIERIADACAHANARKEARRRARRQVQVAERATGTARPWLPV